MTFAESLLGGLAWLALTFAAAWIGTRFLPDAWFQRLNKPPISCRANFCAAGFCITA